MFGFGDTTEPAPEQKGVVSFSISEALMVPSVQSSEILRQKITDLEALDAVIHSGVTVLDSRLMREGLLNNIHAALISECGISLQTASVEDFVRAYLLQEAENQVL
jgi:hypothetical protein